MLELRQLARAILRVVGHRLSGCRERLGSGKAWLTRLQSVVHSQRACRGVFGEWLEHGPRGNGMELGQRDHLARRSARSLGLKTVPRAMAVVASMAYIPLMIYERCSRSALLTNRLPAAAGKLRQTAAGRQHAGGQQGGSGQSKQRTVSRLSSVYQPKGPQSLAHRQTQRSRYRPRQSPRFSPLTSCFRPGDSFFTTSCKSWSIRNTAIGASK